MANSQNTGLVEKIKALIHFDDLFRELYPGHSREQGNSMCAFHEDSAASFQVSPDHGHCHAGCMPPGGKTRRWDIFSLWQAAKGCDFKTAVRDLAERAGIQTGRGRKPKGELIAVYDYTDETGALLFQSCKYATVNKKGQPAKTFSQRRPDGNDGWTYNLDGISRPLPLYRVPEIETVDIVWIPEGEKDCDGLFTLGLTATCNPLGALKWDQVCENGQPPEALRGKTCYVLPDNDKAGADHAEDVARSLHGFASSVKVLDLKQSWSGIPEKGDVSDLIEARGTKMAKACLLELAGSTTEYEPAPQESNSLGVNTDIHETDLGNAARLAGLFGDRIRFCKHFGWLNYDGKRWVLDDLAVVQGFAKATIRTILAEASNCENDDRRKQLARHALKTEQANRLQAMVTLLPSEPDISVLQEAFDQNKMLLNCSNGTVDLTTGNLRPHNPTDLITKLSPVDYIPGAKCERWLQFIDEIMDGDREAADFLQRWLGYCITGETYEQRWLMFYGKGHNGKGTICRNLPLILGQYATATPPDTFMVKRQTGGIPSDIARLRGVRLIVAGDMPESREFDAGLLKSFTGEDILVARFMHKDFFEFRPTGKLTFSGNKKPSVKDNSFGFWRRALILPFPREFDGEAHDPKLDSKLQTEASGILAWLIQGCLAWQREGLNPPASVIEAVREYRDDNDILADFLREYCVIEPGRAVGVTALYKEYTTYFETLGDHKRKPLSPRAFNEDLNSRKGIKKKKTGPERHREWSWFGIGLKSDSAIQEPVQEQLLRNQCEMCGESRTAGGCDIRPVNLRHGIEHCEHFHSGGVQ